MSFLSRFYPTRFVLNLIAMKYAVVISLPEHKTDDYENNKIDFMDKIDLLLQHPLIKNDGCKVYVDPLDSQKQS